MSKLFWEDSLGAKLAEKATEATDRVRELEKAYIDDPEELERAEKAVHDAGEQGTESYKQVQNDWVAVAGPIKISGIMDSAGPNGCLITAPLEANDIPFAWDPYPPEDMPGYRVGYGAVDRPFKVLVPPERAAEARELIGELRGSKSFVGLPVEIERGLKSTSRRRWSAWALLFVFVGFDLLVWAVVSLLRLLGVMK